jgi:hypothetical protein
MPMEEAEENWAKLGKTQNPKPYRELLMISTD